MDDVAGVVVRGVLDVEGGVGGCCGSWIMEMVVGDVVLGFFLPPFPSPKVRVLVGGGSPVGGFVSSAALLVPEGVDLVPVWATSHVATEGLRFHVVVTVVVVGRR